ncbi:ABC transporter substrate-binding protein [Streptomyces sp. NPDC088147]|uniref:ABC transporter substrate-binding protein n=1 Tax=unclassified Streptomyces TaxID=2593676 RepID=UPI00380FC490
MGKRFTGATAALLGMALISGCGGGSASGGDGGGGAGGKKTLEFWGWAPGYEKSAALWNATHPDVKVSFKTIPAGAKGGYEKMFSAVKAGNAPCLAQVGFESVPTFLAEGALENIAPHVGDAAGEFSDFAWNQVSYGDQVVGIPVDVGPQALFYRKDVFAKFGIAPPTTWAEFTTAAEKLRKADSSYALTNFSTESYWFGGLVSQAGGQWFRTTGDSWKVGFDGAESKKVADYWQDLVDRKLVTTETPWSPEWLKGLSSGKTAAAIGAVWMAGVLTENAKDSAGKWAVAPMPQWEKGGKAAGNEGGSTTAVVKGCENAKEAAEFATWMSTDPKSLANLITVTGIYPAATRGRDLPEANKPVKYFGGQKIYDVFNEAAARTDPDWKWGPVMTQAATTFQDAFGKAVGDGSSFSGTLDLVQDKVVADYRAKGLSIAD